MLILTSAGLFGWLGSGSKAFFGQSIESYLEPFLPFFGPSGYFSALLSYFQGWGQAQNIFGTYHCNVDYQFWLWKYSPISFFNLVTFWAFLHFLFLGLVSGSKTFLGAYLFRLSTFVLEVQPYLFDCNSATFGNFILAFLASLRIFFGHFRAIYDWGQVQSIFGTN